MALFALETLMERFGCLHRGIPDDLHGVQVHPHPGPADTDGEADKVVRKAVNR